MKILLSSGIVAVVVIIILSFAPTTLSETATIDKTELGSSVHKFLISKNSPLATETELLLTQKHWKLLVAISAIESQYCTRQIGWNCWGIGGDHAYRKYSSIKEAIVDANNLIEHWQQRGRWLTIEDMNCHYVVPCNNNWVATVKKISSQMNSYEQSVR